MIRNTRTDEVVLARAKVCAGFLSRLIGLQFRRGLAEDEGAIFVRRAEGRLSASVHTIGLRFEIGIVWLNSEMIVVDMKLATPGQLAHVPKVPARVFLEGHPSILERVQIGDRLQIHKGIV